MPIFIVSLVTVFQAKARDALKLKLQSMESKLINGGDVIQKTAIMEKELQEKQKYVLCQFNLCVVVFCSHGTVFRKISVFYLACTGSALMALYLERYRCLIYLVLVLLSWHYI